MFGSVSEKILNRPGGYTRIIKLGKRLGDSAEICFIELVEIYDVGIWNDVHLIFLHSFKMYIY